MAIKYMELTNCGLMGVLQLGSLRIYAYLDAILVSNVSATAKSVNARTLSRSSTSDDPLTFATKSYLEMLARPIPTT